MRIAGFFISASLNRTSFWKFVWVSGLFAKFEVEPQMFKTMHWKTKQKLISTSKIYLTVANENHDKCHEVRLQLPTYEYVLLELHQPIPNKPLYNSLSNGGFNRDENVEDWIAHYNKTQAIKILNSSKGYRNNSSETIDELVKLINAMGHI